MIWLSSSWPPGASGRGASHRGGARSRGSARVGSGGGDRGGGSGGAGGDRGGGGGSGERNVELRNSNSGGNSAVALRLDVAIG